jgi:hypothetical protein
MVDFNDETRHSAHAVATTVFTCTVAVSARKPCRKLQAKAGRGCSAKRPNVGTPGTLAKASESTPPPILWVQVSKKPEKSSKNAMDVGPFGASGTVESVRSTVALSCPWRVVAAGSPITANAYHCAVVSDSPNGGLPDIPYAKVWADGDWQATENRNRKLLEKHFAGLKVEIRTSPTTTINAGRVASLVATIPDDLSIPPFLDRRPLPLQRAA